MRQRLRQQGAAFREFAKSRRGGGTLTASAALLCAGALLTAGSDGGGQPPYVAVGSAGQPASGASGAEGRTVPPEDGVRMVPLPRDGGGQSDGPSGEAPAGPPPASATPPRSPSAGPEAGAPEAGAPETGGGGSGERAGSGGDSGAGTGAGNRAPENGSSPPGGDAAARPAGPPVLHVSKPKSAKRGEGDERWCEKVTVAFRNTGGRSVESGTVTFETHIIGALGVDWGTVKSERKLPAPVEPGERKKKSWKVCVDPWRVPLGMHTETQDLGTRDLGPREARTADEKS